MSSLPSLVRIGFIQKTHGYKGQLRCVIEEDIPLHQGEWVFVQLEQKPVPFFIEHIEGSAEHPVLKFQDLTSEDQAARLLGSDLYYPGTLTELSFRPEHLIGFSVFNPDEEEIGEITDYIEHPGQSLLLVNIDGQEVFVPMHEQFILDISEEERWIMLDIPDDLLHLNSHS